MASVADLTLVVQGRDEASKVLDGIGKKAGLVGSAMGTALKAGALGGAVAIAGIGVAGFSAASDATNAAKQIQASLGATEEDAKRLGKVAQDVFKNNFAGSITEAGQTITQAFKTIGDVGDTELQGIAENAHRLQDAFGVETGASIDAAKTLMDNFGLSSKEAFDQLAAGYQQGLDRSGDFLDTVNEYSTQFGNAGADADDFFRLLDSGLQGGMLGTDRAADAFKEFGVRILDGSKTTKDAMASLGLDDVLSDIESGQINVADGFGAVIDEINKIEDPATRMQVGVGLLGTQFEDMGTDAALAMSLTGDAFSDTEGAAESLDAQYATLGNKLEEIKRTVLVALIPAFQAVTGFVLDTVIPSLESFAEWLGPKLKAAADTAAGVFDGIKSAIMDNVVAPVQELIDLFQTGFGGGEIGGEFSDIERAAFKLGQVIKNDVLPFIDDVREGFDKFMLILKGGDVGGELGGVEKAFVDVARAIKPFTDAAGEFFDLINASNKEILIGIAAVIGGALTLGFIALGVAAAGAAVGVLASLAPFIAIAAAIAGVVTVIVLVIKHWDAIKAKVIEVATAIHAKIEETFPGISLIVATVFGLVKDYITQAISTAKSVIETFISFITENWGAVETVIAFVIDNVKTKIEGFIQVIQGIVAIVAGVITTLKAVFEGDWAAAWEGMKTAAEGVLDLLIGTIKTMFGNIPGIILEQAGEAASAALSFAEGIGTSMADGIVSGISSIASKVGEIASDIQAALKSAVNQALRWAHDNIKIELGSVGIGPASVDLGSLNFPLVQLAKGTPFVPADMPAMLHKGEAIIPAAQNPFNPANQGAGGVTIVNNFNAPVYGFQDFEDKINAVVRDRILAGGFRGVLGASS